MHRTERRECVRFVINGATLHYRKEGFFSSKKYSDDFFPVLDMSLGGVRFLAQQFLKTDTEVSLKILIPGEEEPLMIKGKARWLSVNPEKSYKYQVGVQFNRYGSGKGENPPEILEKLKALEKKYSTPNK